METITLTNDYDLALATGGSRGPQRIRSVVVEARVDAGAAMLMLPADVVERLGLPIRGYRNVRYGEACVEVVPWIVGVNIEVRGRATVVAALVGAVGSTPRIGQIPLDRLDFVVDRRSGELRHNPGAAKTPSMDLLGAA